MPIDTTRFRDAMTGRAGLLRFVVFWWPIWFVAVVIMEIVFTGGNQQ